ncbi:hypothetical protein, partial [Nocardiopsis alba]|uniref:hypothetical protein n=1 Tax=Nocardiopsis alba TaxID=53437 RepID=UPI00366D0C35
CPGVRERKRGETQKRNFFVWLLRKKKKKKKRKKGGGGSARNTPPPTYVHITSSQIKKGESSA